MTDEGVQKAKDAFDELGKLNPTLAHQTAKRLLENPEDIGMTAEELRADMRRRSPAMAAMQDLVGNASLMHHAKGVVKDQALDRDVFSAVDEGGFSVPGEVAAAVETNRYQLLQPLRHKIEKQGTAPLKDMQGVHALLLGFYRKNTEDPILSDLLAALEPAEEALTAEGDLPVEICLDLLDKLKAVLVQFDHRRDEVNEGSIPYDQIRDGPTRIVAHYTSY